MKRLRGAVVGYGFIAGHGHVPAYIERMRTRGDVEIVAVADVTEERRRLAAHALPGVRLYADHGALLQAEGGALDFIDIATPPCDHAAITHAALDRGLHVLCEKPLTTTVEEAQSVLTHAMRARRVIFPCHNYKHAPVVKAIRDVIQSNRIGRVHTVTLNTFRNTHAKGVPQWNPHWRRHREWSGGGIAMDHGSHTFYLAMDWLGSLPLAVTAKMSNRQSDRFDTEDAFAATVTFQSGVASAFLSWTSGVRKVIYALQGTQGAITVDDDEMQVAVMERGDGPDVAQGAIQWKVERRTIGSNWMDASHVNWFNSLFDQFREAIEKDDFVGSEARQALLCVQLIRCAYQSAEQDCREVALSPLMDFF